MSVTVEAPSPSLSALSFGTLRMLFERESGIRLDDSKKTLIVSRLAGRLRQRGVPSMEAYCALLMHASEVEERQRMVDALTTHETYFFREPKHFEHLSRQALPSLAHRPLRVWSAAASSGEETYSIAMVLAEQLGPAGWELLGSDLSSGVLDLARRGLYATSRLDCMPREYLARYCRRGLGDYEGMLLINSSLRARAKFFRHNLLDASQRLGMFDIIFLRNVLIYFDQERRRYILNNMLARLNPGGYLYLGASDCAGDRLDMLEACGPTVFRRVQPRPGS